MSGHEDAGPSAASRTPADDAPPTEGGPPGHDPPRVLARWILAGAMLAAGAGHFVAHEEFLGQTPTRLPGRSLIVWGSGVIEIAFGFALIGARRRRREIGWALAVFLVLVFPGNIHQALAGTDAFGLDSPTARWIRLLFQPLLIVWALWCTGAWPRPDTGRD